VTVLAAGFRRGSGSAIPLADERDPTNTKGHQEKDHQKEDQEEARQKNQGDGQEDLEVVGAQENQSDKESGRKQKSRRRTRQR